MTTAKRYTLVIFLLLFSISAGAQDGHMKVNLEVKHNGKRVPTPEHVTLTIDKHSMEIPVRNGRFEIPPEVTQSKSVAFSVVIGKNQIRTTGIHGAKFDMEKWTLILEDRRFADEFQPLSKGAKARSSCILVFEPKGGDSTVLFDSSCRTKIL